MPKPFKFKLEKILDFRKQAEEQARHELAEAQRLQKAQEAVVEGLELKMSEHLAKEYDNLTAADFWLWRQYDDALKQDLIAAKNRFKQLALNLQRARMIAIEKSKERKLLEKLKENQAGKYYEEENLKEQKEYDEMATIRFKPKDF